jgi:hypothetical protein
MKFLLTMKDERGAALQVDIDSRVDREAANLVHAAISCQREMQVLMATQRINRRA